jgi:transketolase
MKEQLEATPELDQLCINTIRTLAIDAVQKANSGHPGLPLGAAPMAYVLWTRFMRYNPKNPKWENRDRFLLSAGHGSMLLYSLLYLTGYDLSLDEIKNFRQWESKTPGHPEYGLTPGVEITTGPLGQGFANGVGMAMGAAHLAAKFNQKDFSLIDHNVYAIVSDGDLMEGVASEAASLAGHLKLGKLIYLYDDNHVTIEGFTDLAFSENVPIRFEAYGWHTSTVADGNDLAAIEAAIRDAQSVADRPSLISVKTTIGYGMPTAGTRKAHSDAPGEEAVKETKRHLGWPEDKQFYVPDEALAHFREAIERGAQQEREWKELVKQYQEQHAELRELWQQTMSGELPPDWETHLPDFADAKPVATRVASGQVINALAPHMPMLIGGSADLGVSNNTDIKDSGDFEAGSYDGRILHFGVREHAMGATLTGMSLNGGLIPFGGTFMCFSDYMRPSIRLACLSEVQVIYVFTHDSIGLGEDGPTHQPIEHLAALRAIPPLFVIRPADVHEVREAWRLAILRRHAPTALALTRQKVPLIDRQALASANGLRRGGYVLAEAEAGSGEPGTSPTVREGSVPRTGGGSDGASESILSLTRNSSSEVRIIKRVFDDRDAESLKHLALALIAHPKVVALLGSRDGDTARLVFARSADAPGDMNSLMHGVCVIVGGRGGGKPDMAQGGGKNVEKLDEALNSAISSLRERHA